MTLFFNESNTFVKINICKDVCLMYIWTYVCVNINVYIAKWLNDWICDCKNIY